MHTIRFLLYIQFLQLQVIGTFKKSSIAKKILIIIGLIFLIMLVAIPTILWIISPALMLATFGLSANIPAFALATASIALFFLSAARARLLFSEKDWPLLASLPIPTWKIVYSKFLFLYLLLFSLNALIMLPQIIIFELFQSTAIVSSLIFLLLIMLVVPLLPLVLGALLTLALAHLANRFNKIDMRQIYALIFSLLGLGVLFFQFWAVFSNSHSILDEVAAQTLALNTFNKITKAYLPAWLLLPEFIGSFYLGGSLFILLSIALFLGFIYFVSKDYSRIHSYVTKKTIIIKKETINQQYTPLETLIRKEFLSFSQFPTLLMNLGFSYVFALIVCGSLLFTDLATIIQSAQIDVNIGSYVTYAYIMGFIISTLGIYAASSLSLEGKNIWIIQTLPVSFRTIFYAKLLTSLILQLIPIGLFAIALFIKDTLPIFQILSIILWLLCYAFFTSVSNIWLNFMLPKYNWKSEVEVVKQSAATFCATVGNMILLAIFFFMSIVPAFTASRDAIFILQMVFFILLGAFVYAWLARQQLYIKSKA